MNDRKMQFDGLWNKIGSHGIMVLSTCADNRVTSRAMSVVVFDGRFYCQTDERYLKCSQIKINPNVSLCMNNFSVEGECCLSGRSYENEFFVEVMKLNFPDAVSRWSHLPNECVLEITPRLVSSWIYEDNRPYIERWDFKNNMYIKEEQL